MHVCEQRFHMSHVPISQKVKGVFMWNLKQLFSILTCFQIYISVPLSFFKFQNKCGYIDTADAYFIYITNNSIYLGKNKSFSFTPWNLFTEISSANFFYHSSARSVKIVNEYHIPEAYLGIIYLFSAYTKFDRCWSGLKISLWVLFRNKINKDH